jgi:hypothetical protein
MCATNFDSYGKDLTLLGVQWAQEFQKYDDELMETAVRGCITFGKKFPMVSEIHDAIRDLQYKENTKPKQLPWDVKRDTAISDKAFKFVAEGRAAEYMANVDISKLLQYARYFFPDISEQLVRKNYSEFAEGLQSSERCLACRLDKHSCITAGYLVKHSLGPNGWISNEMARCCKNIK